MSIEGYILDLQARVRYLETLPQPAFTPWTDWTPTVTQSGAVTVTVTSARYCIVEKVAHVQANLLVTGSGTIANAIVIGGQPTAIQSAVLRLIGSAYILDSGATFYGGLSLLAVGATDWRMRGYTATNYMGDGPSFALASPDQIHFVAVYELP